MIRFKIDVLKELKEKGYNTNKLRNDSNIRLSESTIQKIRVSCKNNSDININLNAINTICELLKKQPGQLLEFIPDSENE